MWYNIVFCIAFYLFMLLFSRFVYDDVDCQCPVELHSPKLSDLPLDDCKDRIAYEQKAEKYIDNHIKPAYYYFILRNKLSSIGNSGDCLTAFFLQCLAFAPILRQITDFLQSISFILDGIFVILAIAVLFGINYLIELIPICKRIICIPKFEYADEQQLKKQFEFKTQFSDNDFEVSEDVAWNNFVLDVHYEYLLSIEKTVLLRKNWRTGIWAIMLFYVSIFLS